MPHKLFSLSCLHDDPLAHSPKKSGSRTSQYLGKWRWLCGALSRSDDGFHFIQQSCLEFEIRRWDFQKYVGSQPIISFDIYVRQAKRCCCCWLVSATRQWWRHYLVSAVQACIYYLVSSWSGLTSRSGTTPRCARCLIETWWTLRQKSWFHSKTKWYVPKSDFERPICTT